MFPDVSVFFFNRAPLNNDFADFSLWCRLALRKDMDTDASEADTRVL